MGPTVSRITRWNLAFKQNYRYIQMCNFYTRNTSTIRVISRQRVEEMDGRCSYNIRHWKLKRRKVSMKSANMSVVSRTRELWLVIREDIFYNVMLNTSGLMMQTCSCSTESHPAPHVPSSAALTSTVWFSRGVWLDHVMNFNGQR